MNQDPSPIATLRDMPSIDEILGVSELDSVLLSTPRVQVVNWVRQSVQKLRERVHSGEAVGKTRVQSLVIDGVLALQRADQSFALQHVINATGVLLHTNLGRAPLAKEAVERVVAVSRYANLELDLESGKRSHRGSRACLLLAQLTGAQGAIVVNNCAAATVLALQGVARGKEVIVSRGQLVEIGGGFRLPEVFVAAGVRLKEIGTTNRTYVKDYGQAIGEETGAIIRVHRSNFYQAGFIAEPSIGEIVEMSRPSHVPVIDDLGSGIIDSQSLNQSSQPNSRSQFKRDNAASQQHAETEQVTVGAVGWEGEPSVKQSMKAGADLCLFSGDKLFGGPQCGIIVGKEKWLERLRKSPLMRALRTDKMTLAALEATVELHLAGRTEEIPFYRMVQLSPDTIRERCQSVVEALGPVTGGSVSIEPSISRIGGGSMPQVELPSWCVCLRWSSSEVLTRKLRSHRPSIQCRQSEDCVLLDLRTVQIDELEPLVAALRSCCSL